MEKTEKAEKTEKEVRTHKLVLIQNELNVPKLRKNEFAHFRYRSFEDITDAIKPLMVKYNCLIHVTDEIKLVGDRYYIEATASFLDVETGEVIETKAFAREGFAKKGNDEPQLTGTATSYANKYALSILLNIDDNVDTDSMDNQSKMRSVEEDIEEILKISDYTEFVNFYRTCANAKSQKFRENEKIQEHGKILGLYNDIEKVSKMKDISKIQDFANRSKYRETPEFVEAVNNSIKNNGIEI